MCFEITPKAEPRITIRIVCVIVVLAASGSTLRSETAFSQPKRVLLVHHYDRESPSVVFVDRGFERIIKAVPSGVEYYREALESYRFPSQTHEELMVQYLKQKYAATRIDVVVAYTDTSLEFLLRHRSELFPSVPIVYAVTKKFEPGSEPENTSGIWTGPNIKETLEMALQLQPDTREVYVVGGSSNSNRMVEVEVAEQLKEFQSELQVTFLLDLPLEDVLARVKTLPPHSIVIYQRQTKGLGGQSITPIDALRLLTQAANAPVYGTFDVWLGEGIVGGRIISLEDLGARLAAIALKVTSGTPIRQIPPETARLFPMVDWRQLKRWHISESALPADCIVRFKEATLWEQYKWRIIGVLLLCALEALLIAILLIERRKRQVANQSLDERLKFETFLSKLSAQFADVSSSGVDGLIDRWIGKLRKFLKVDGVQFVNLSSGAPELDGRKDGLSLNGGLEAYYEQLRKGETLNVDNLPPRSESDGSLAATQTKELKSMLALPVSVSKRRYALIIYATHNHRVWPEDFLSRLRVIAEIFAGALERKQDNDELQKTRTDLAHVSRLTSMGEMAASIAHEVNQPLAAIAAYGDACVRLLSNERPNVPKSLEAIDHIISDSMRASEVIKRIRGLVKKSTGVRAPLDLNEVIREILSLTDGDLRTYNIKLILQLSENLPLILGDRVELQQVILNLILNGIEAMSSIDNRPRNLAISSDVDQKGHVLISVRDSGVGISVEHAARIFENFVTTKPNGLGMGLSISRTIIESHGGALWAESSEGPGANFQFNLPSIGPEV